MNPFAESEGLPMVLSRSKKTFYDTVRKRHSLKNAWKKVRENGLQSPSSDTKTEIREFELVADSKIDRIYRELLKKKFKFNPAHGLAAKKPGKTKRRPIVIAPIESRIVQRSILDTLHSHPILKEYENHPSSFGGIGGRGVPEAINALSIAIDTGFQYYIKSDIHDFFTSIPKSKILSIIGEHIPESDFLNLFSNAIAIELENMKSLGDHANIFPLHEIGIAQGCCLSPFLGNIILNKFDKEMNGRGIVCLRYIDDFILLGQKPSTLEKTFENGLKILSDLNLTAYRPGIDNTKASQGHIKDGFNFLGCDILPGRIRPDKKAKTRLLYKIDEIIENAKNKNLSYLSG